MNHIRKLCRPVAASRPRSPGREAAVRCRTTWARVATAMSALALPLLAGLVSAGPASASTTPALYLSSNSYDAWVASGSSYTWGLSNVDVWIRDVTNGTRATLEYQSGVQTSVGSVTCSIYGCVLIQGGLLSAQGASYWVSVPPGGFGYPGYWQAEHPLACGHRYQAASYDPSDGLVFSNVLIEPACPSPPQ